MLGMLLDVFEALGFELVAEVDAAAGDASKSGFERCMVE